MLIIIPADVDDSSWANSVLPLLGFTGIDFRRASVKLAFPPGRSPFERGEFGDALLDAPSADAVRAAENEVERRSAWAMTRHFWFAPLGSDVWDVAPIREERCFSQAIWVRERLDVSHAPMLDAKLDLTPS